MSYKKLVRKVSKTSHKAVVRPILTYTAETRPDILKIETVKTSETVKNKILTVNRKRRGYATYRISETGWYEDVSNATSN